MKKKVLNLIMIVFFLCMLIAPLVFTDFQGGKLSSAEQRMLASFPEISSVSDIHPAEIESWLDDNIGGRGLASSLVTRINYHLWRNSKKQNVYFGKEDWIFYATSPILDDYIGNHIPAEETIAESALRLQKFQDYLEDRGCAFAAYLLPDKKTVYREYYMRGIEPIVQQRRSDKIVDYFAQHSDMEFTFLRDHLIEAKDKGILYSPRIDDAHWNQLGAYVGYQYMAQNAQKKVPSVRIFSESEVKIQEKTVEGKFFETVPVSETDYDITLGHESIVTADNEYMDAFDGLLSYADAPAAYKRRYVNNSEDLPKLLLIGDSYSLALFQYLAQSFSEVTYIHILDLPQVLPVLEKTAPDVVILACVERMLSGCVNELQTLEEALPQ